MKKLIVTSMMVALAMVAVGCMPSYRCISTHYISSLPSDIPRTVTVGSVMVQWQTYEDCIGEQAGHIFTKYTKDEFSQELIYSGMSGNAVFILYREYSGRLIREAFTQQLTYDLNKSRRLTFRGAILDVEDATSSHISFQVKAQLSPEYEKVQ